MGKREKRRCLHFFDRSTTYIESRLFRCQRKKQPFDHFVRIVPFFHHVFIKIPICELKFRGIFLAFLFSDHRRFFNKFFSPRKKGREKLFWQPFSDCQGLLLLLEAFFLLPILSENARKKRGGGKGREILWGGKWEKMFWRDEQPATADHLEPIKKRGFFLIPQIWGNWFLLNFFKTKFSDISDAGRRSFSPPQSLPLPPYSCVCQTSSSTISAPLSPSFC